MAKNPVTAQVDIDPPCVAPQEPQCDELEESSHSNGANFTVAQRAVPEWKGYPDTPYGRTGFSGQIGGLAVYNRVLSAEQIASIHAAVDAQNPEND